jgi:hypothetical protein
MAADNEFNIMQAAQMSPEMFDQQQELNRKQQLAKLLMSQGTQQPTGQMVSGRYVPTSFFQNIAPVANMLTGAYLQNKGDEQAKALAAELRGTRTTEMDAINQAIANKDWSKAQQLINASTTGAGKEMLPRLMERNIPALEKPQVVPKGGTLIGPDGQVIYRNPGAAEGEGGMGMPSVNNNGIKVGTYDKMGRYRSPTGQVYSSKAVDEARAEHDAATDLAYKLNQLSKGDIKNAYGSAFDYSGSKIGQMVANPTTLDAQTKINSLQIGSVLKNLSQLKGASSDKEMAQMIKDFPGYTADPSVMESWAERAAAATNRFLKRSEGRFGFDTDYAEQGRFDGKGAQPKGEIATPGAPKVGEIRDGQDGKYRFKGGDQYDQNNWVKVK